MPRQTEVADVDCIYLHQTENAVLIRIGDMDAAKPHDVWVPKKCCQLPDVPLRRGKVIELQVDQWFAEKEGLC